jgi:hypothetical protein
MKRIIRFFKACTLSGSYWGLAILIGIFGLSACNGPAASVNPEYGKLQSAILGTSYSLPELTEYAYKALCINMDTTNPTCQANLTKLAQLFDGYTINQIAENNLGITSAKEYNITYTTQGLHPGSPTTYFPTIVSGGVVIPQGIDYDKIKGVILFYNGAAFNKNDYSPQSDLLIGKLFASLWASQGYIVVFPDYLGYGEDRQDLHPYVLFPEANVLTGINMLRATYQLLSALGISGKPLNLFVSGYSEGGPYALWTSYLLQNQTVSLAGTNLVLKASVPMDGAYDITNAQIPFEVANLSSDSGKNTYNILTTTAATQQKMGVIPFIMTSFAYYYGLQCSDVMYAQFCNLSDLNVGYTVPELFELVANQPSDALIVAYLYAQATKMPSPYSESNNSIGAFVMLPLHPQFLKAAATASLVSWKTNSPITFISLDYDSIVTNINTYNAYNGIKSQSDPALVNKLFYSNYDFSVCATLNSQCGPVDHTTIGGITLIAALSVFNSYSATSLVSH